MICLSSASQLGFIQPEIPSLVPEPPSGGGWTHEIKHDGYRTLVVIDRGQIRAFTRNGNDWTKSYRRVVEAAGKLRCQAAILDGEMVVQDENGISDFHALQSAVHSEPHRIVFFAFDLLHHEGDDLRGMPLVERRATLRQLIRPDPKSPIQFSDHVEGDGAAFFEAAAKMGLEGIISKRSASRYRSGRSRSWLKTKNMVESDYILIGTDRDSNGVPRAFLASEDKDGLRFAGAALFALPKQERAELADAIAERVISRPPISGVPFKPRQWLRPELRVRVKHLKASGTLRHATVRSCKIARFGVECL